MPTLKTTNENYAVTVVRPRTVVELPGLDNLVGVPVLGYQALTSKDIKLGELYLVITSETQLAPEFLSNNNLYRHAYLNKDPETPGYVEDNGRIKAIRLRGHRSDALILPLESVAYLGVTSEDVKEGDTFNSVDGVEIAWKFTIKNKKPNFEVQGRRRFEPRVDERLFPKHFDTPNLFRNIDVFGPLDNIVVTQKLHGTSVRIGHIPVKRTLKWYEKVAKKLGVKVKETEWSMVYGSRNVVKDSEREGANDYYILDVHTTVGSRLKGLVPKGYLVFGEIIGYVPGTLKSLQAGYTYGLAQGEAQLYIYRVATINEDGLVTDLTWNQVKEFAESIDVPVVPEVTQQEWYLLRDEIESFLDIELATQFYGTIPTGGFPDEGVCVRKDGLRPIILKAKSPQFLQLESALLDDGIQDTDVEEEEV